MATNVGRTQKETVLNHLRKNTTITPLEAFHVYGIYRLSSIIERLRKDGHEITTQMREAPNGSQYGQYRLHLSKFEKRTERVPIHPAQRHAESNRAIA